MSRTTGRYIRRMTGGEQIAAFVPDPLPPKNPPLLLDTHTQNLLGAAEQKLARLDEAGEIVPSLDWFLYAFVRKEAVVSSQIEGTQATLVDLLAYEVGAPVGDKAELDIREVCNYLDALTYARKQLLRPDGLPLSMRLLNESHRRLMKGIRGASKQPGEIRRTQNWIGGTRPGNAAFVPPPPEELPGLLGDLEKYIHTQDDLPPLARAGLVHAQFETIHPYLDGNGRIGRLLVALLLEHNRILSTPLLYLSLYFKRHRDEYYHRLDAVRREGDWEGWTTFFLEGVLTIAGEAAAAARELFAIVGRHRARLLGGRHTTVAAMRLLERLPQHPVVTIPAVARLLRTTLPTASKAVAVLQQQKILVEMTGRRRDRVFHYREYLDRLRTGTELDEESSQ